MSRAVGVAIVISVLGAGCDQSAPTRKGVAQVGPEAGYGMPNPMPGTPIADAGIAPPPTITPYPTTPAPTAPITPGAPTTPSPPGAPPPTIPGAPPAPTAPGAPPAPGR